MNLYNMKKKYFKVRVKWRNQKEIKEEETKRKRIKIKIRTKINIT